MVSKKRVAVVVVGDVGRSPRMQYHALSLASQAKCNVDLIGLQGSDCWPEVANSDSITLRLIPNSWRALERLGFLGKILKVLWQTLVLFWTMMTIPRPGFILVQTPPAIPVLVIAHVVSWLRWARLIIDCHNYGYTILNLSRPGHWSVWVYRLYESLFLRGAHGVLCVSEGMRQDLKQRWGVDAVVLYDRPPSFFRRATLPEMHQLFLHHKFGSIDGVSDPRPLAESTSQPAQTEKVKTLTRRRRRSGAGDEDADPQKTIESESVVSTSTTTSTATSSSITTAFTHHDYASDSITLNPDRPILIVSSTSWTKDEDFGILLDAIVELEKKENGLKNFPHIRLVVTGKGDLREYYEEEMRKKQLTLTKLYTTFLSYKDYVTLLGSADLGICLHYSSSGVDLPMKVVDMFGCGLPVCAIKLPELVKHQENSLIFNDANELAQQLLDLFKFFPKTPELDSYRKELNKFQQLRWNESWEANALPLFK